MPCRPRRRPVRRGPGRVRGAAPECGMRATGAATRRRRGAGGGGPLPADAAAFGKHRKVRLRLRGHLEHRPVRGVAGPNPDPRHDLRLVLRFAAGGARCAAPSHATLWRDTLRDSKRRRGPTDQEGFWGFCWIPAPDLTESRRWAVFAQIGAARPPVKHPPPCASILASRFQGD